MGASSLLRCGKHFQRTLCFVVINCSRDTGYTYAISHCSQETQCVNSFRRSGSTRCMFAGDSSRSYKRVMRLLHHFLLQLGKFPSRAKIPKIQKKAVLDRTSNLSGEAQATKQKGSSTVSAATDETQQDSDKHLKAHVCSHNRDTQMQRKPLKLAYQEMLHKQCLHPHQALL